MSSTNPPALPASTANPCKWRFVADYLDTDKLSKVFKEDVVREPMQVAAPKTIRVEVELGGIALNPFQTSGQFLP